MNEDILKFLKKFSIQVKGKKIKKFDGVEKLFPYKMRKKYSYMEKFFFSTEKGDLVFYFHGKLYII